MTERDELHDVLASLTDPDFRDEVSGSAAALSDPSVRVTKSGRAVPVSELLDVYGARRRAPNTPTERAHQFEKLLRVATLRGQERWHIYSVVGEQPLFAVFSDEAGNGRVCIDLR